MKKEVGSIKPGKWFSKKVEKRDIQTQEAASSALSGADYEEMIASVSCAIATVMGKDVRGIRIHSVKKLD